MSTHTGVRPDVNDGSDPSPERHDFIRDIVAEDLKSGRVGSVVTRFPPEPNGQLHIGHAKSICLNFGIAQQFGGRCNLRFDDTNPTREEQHYVESIQADVRWLGFDWAEHLYYASDNFEQLYAWACQLISAGKAYVDDLTGEQIREHRGTLTEPGINSPFRDRSVDENLDLFARMRAGEFPDGTRVLRAKIDMASPNINFRDPVLYRILNKEHPRTGDTWSIYPTYDYAHGQSDAIEGITHSICTLEFENHRPLYDWLIENLPVPSRPRQYEFARLNLTYTVLSKRFLKALVDDGRVRGWDDPRMPTISGIRRRGYPAAAIRDFAAENRRQQARRGRGGGPARARCAQRAQPGSTAPFRGAAAPQGGHRQLPGRPGRADGCHQQPRGRCCRHAQGALLAGALDRARRLHGGPATQVLPSGARTRGTSPLRLLRDLHRGHQGCRRPDRRATVHLRPCDSGRRRTRWPAPQGHAALALGATRGRGGGSSLSGALHAARSGC